MTQSWSTQVAPFLPFLFSVSRIYGVVVNEGCSLVSNLHFDFVKVDAIVEKVPLGKGVPLKGRESFPSCYFVVPTERFRRLSYRLWNFD